MEKKLIIRGQRNNNPLNIKTSKAKWVGKVSDPALKKDKTFEEFDTMVNGIRAAIKLIQNYIKSGYNTVDTIVHRWCPDGTAPAYQRMVHREMAKNIGDYDPLKPIRRDDYATLFVLVAAMAWIESIYRISEQEFSEAWNAL